METKAKEVAKVEVELVIRAMSDGQVRLTCPDNVSQALIYGLLELAKDIIRGANQNKAERTGGIQLPPGHG